MKKVRRGEETRGERGQKGSQSGRFFCTGSSCLAKHAPDLTKTTVMNYRAERNMAIQGDRSKERF